MKELLCMYLNPVSLVHWGFSIAQKLFPNRRAVIIKWFMLRIDPRMDPRRGDPRLLQDPRIDQRMQVKDWLLKITACQARHFMISTLLFLCKCFLYLLCLCVYVFQLFHLKSQFNSIFLQSYQPLLSTLYVFVRIYVLRIGPIRTLNVFKYAH